MLFTIRSQNVAVGCQGLRIVLFEPFSELSHLPSVATGCARLALSEEGPRVESSLLVHLLSRSRTVGMLISFLALDAHRVGGSCLGFSIP
jgi:hypothetical protein